MSDAETARGAGIARSTVQDYLKRIAATGVDPQQLKALGDEALDQRLFPPRDAGSSGRALPDWEAVERDLRGRGMTLRLLWQEYLDMQPGGYQYTQFLRLYRSWQKASRPPVMRQTHHAGVALEVDYAGMTLTVVDMGQPREAQIFVACLPCSQLIYAEASWSQGHEDWLSSHVRALAWIGGCPQTLVPDNLKSGVTDASYYDPVLNRSYHELARHYGIAVLPARVRRPRDKSSVESSVNQVERWVLAPLRNRQLLSLEEANAAILERVEAFNRRPFSPAARGQPPLAVRSCRARRSQAAARRALRHRQVAHRTGKRGLPYRRRPALLLGPALPGACQGRRLPVGHRRQRLRQGRTRGQPRA